jgi:hypothetical protein
VRVEAIDKEAQSLSPNGLGESLRAERKPTLGVDGISAKDYCPGYAGNLSAAVDFPAREGPHRR